MNTESEAAPIVRQLNEAIQRTDRAIAELKAMFPTPELEAGDEVTHRTNHYNGVIWSLQNGVAIVVTDETCVNGETRPAWTTYRAVNVEELTPVS